MAGALLEIKYFNTFFLKKIVNDPLPVWNGSFGIPSAIGGYASVTTSDNTFNWAIEESRIRGGYNNTNVDYGAKAYIVEDEPQSTSRVNSLIYSGVFNSRTGVNQTNVFSVAEDITKTADPANGSIQKLYAEDTNLSIFQELKCSRALIDKDAIYSAEGGGTVTSSNLVIGVIQPYTGEYGISRNPESFAVYGYRKYFSDTNNNVILRLSKDGLTEISGYGMKDFFRKSLSKSRVNIVGGYDIYSNEYLVSIQSDNSTNENAKTLNFDERAQGWVSFFSYEPDQAFSLKNNFYTVKTTGGAAQLWKHYSSQVNRGNFYGVDRKSSIEFIFNPNPTNSKSFKTIAYEGSNGWEVENFISDETGKSRGVNGNWGISQDTGTGVADINNISKIKSYGEGEYVLTEGSGVTLAASTVTTVLLNTESFTGLAVAGSVIDGAGISPGTTVVSYNSTTGLLTASQIMAIALGATLNFSGAVSQVDYNTIFSTINPDFDRYYCGFLRKENKYVANLLNNSQAAVGEVLFGESISGIKGFYSTVKLSTDSTTDLGGEKTLFSVESVYTMNNGY